MENILTTRNGKVDPNKKKPSKAIKDKKSTDQKEEVSDPK